MGKLKRWAGSALSRLKAISGSRRVRVIAAMCVLFGARWYFLGRPSDVELGAFVTQLGLWGWAEARRRTEGAIAGSSRFLAMLAGQVLPVVADYAGIVLDDQVVALLTGLIATHVIQDTTRRHDGEGADGQADIPADIPNGPDDPVPAGG